MLLLKCAVFDSRKSKFIKEQEASRLLSSLGIKKPFSRPSFVLRLYNEWNSRQFFIGRR